MVPPRIYFDNAATSWPKPNAVYAAVDDYQRNIGAPAGRGTYADAVEADRILARARAGTAQLIRAEDARHLVITCSGTDSLNMAIHGLVRPGDHVVTTVCEHNSVLRPLSHWLNSHQAEATYVPCDGQGFVSPDDVRHAVRPNTRLVAVIHASNVTGAVQPVAEIGRIVRQSDALFLVDAAQTLGHLEIDVDRLGIDLLAAPGHKGLLAPLGTGVLYIRPGVEHLMRPLRQGGTGSFSESDRQPNHLPDKFEPGNHNMPGIAGLAAAIDFLQEQTVPNIARRQRRLTEQLLAGLHEIPGVHVFGPSDAQNRISVVSLTIRGYDAQELASLLGASHGVQCRGGLHCAPRMHQALGTIGGGGTVRLSLGFSTNDHDVEAALIAIRQISVLDS